MDKQAVKLSEEDTSKVYMIDMPEQSEYQEIIYDAQEAGKQLDKSFEKSNEANRKAWTGISSLMASCIARGMRLATEAHRKDKSKWPSYCRMCMRRDGKDPHEIDECPWAHSCEHYPFKGEYTPPKQ